MDSTSSPSQVKRQKVMVFIARPKADRYEWLARHNSPAHGHGGDRWYVVTGNVEPRETLAKAAAREAQEETGIDTHTVLVKLPFVNRFVTSDDQMTNFEEQAYLLVTEYSGQIVLNVESTDYQWLSLDDFVAKIWWPSNKEKLKSILQEAID